MAALTWRDVSAPNFGASNGLFETGANLQQKALSSLGDAIAAAQKTQDAGVDSAVLARALQVNDPAAYQQNLNNGTFLAGVDPSKVSPQTLGALGARATQLLGQANTRQGMTDAQYKQDRTVSLDQIQDAARTAAAQAYGIKDPRLAALSPEQQLAVAAGSQNLQKGAQGLRQGELNIEGTRLNNTNRSFQNDVQARNDNADQSGLNTATNIMRSSADATDALAQLEQMNDLTPREYASAANYLSKTYGNLYAPTGAPAAGASKTAAPGGAGGAPGTAAGSPYDATFNFQGTSKPITSMPISQVLDVQEGSKTTQGHSPMGAFQINKATLEGLAPQVLGDDWKSKPFTPEVQEQLAKALFEQRKGGDLSKTWSSLPNSTPGAYKNFSWDDMRSLIATGETGQGLPSDRATLNLLAQASQQDYKRRQSQNNSVGVTADIDRNYTDTRPSGEIAQELVKNQFPKADGSQITGMINKITRENPGLSAADAGSIIARSARDSHWYTSGTTSFGDGVGVSNSALKQNIKDYKQGQADRSSLSNNITRGQAAQLDAAQQNYNDAFNNFMAVQRRAKIQPGISTERAESEFNRAEAQLKKALATQRSDPNYRPTR